MRLSLKDVGLATSVPAIWGMGITFAKAGLVEFPPLFLMSMRFSIAAVVLFWFFPAPKGQLRAIFFIALVSATIQYGFTFTGLASLDASTAIIICQLEVPFGALFAALVFKDHLGWKRALGMALAFLGVALIAGAPNLRHQLFPAFLVVCGAFTWALGQMMVKKMVTVSGFQLIAWVSVFAGPQMLIASLLIEEGHMEAVRHATIVGWSAVIYTGLVMTAIGYAIWYHVLKKYEINQIMPFLLLTPVTTIIGAVCFLGERPNSRTLFGGAIVIIGVALVTLLGQNRSELPVVDTSAQHPGEQKKNPAPSG